MFNRSPADDQSWLRSAALWLLTAFVVASAAHASSAAPGPSATPNAQIERSAGEVEIEDRLIAPCCWMQTLASHESPLASTLRREIRLRLAEGEHGFDIEDELARRYGERIRAVPRGKDPFSILPIALGMAMVAAAIVLWRIAIRTSTNDAAPSAPVAIGDDEEDRLSFELDRYDDES